MKLKIALTILIPLLTTMIVAYLTPDPREPRATQRQTPASEEGCRKDGCHAEMTGFAQAHNPESIGCASCHLGDPGQLDKDKAHRDMVLVPGNLAEAAQTCGSAACHPELTKNINTTLMTTGRGMVTVNRYVFGEQGTPDGMGHLARLSDSAADDHLRHLCAACHLGQEKVQAAPIDALSRGGGCSACHIVYADSARSALQTKRETGQKLIHHPTLTVDIPDDNCFGCHSRSGRISTNYAGWHETFFTEDTVPDSLDVRRLPDERIFRKETADVHHDKGLRCIDCHTWRETMGDGKSYNHQEEQTEVRCGDCHFREPLLPVNPDSLTLIDAKLLMLRGWSLDSLVVLPTHNRGRALLNVQLDENQTPFLLAKSSGKRHPLKPPVAICGEAIDGHERLSCKSCHTAWAPQCIGCHTFYDPGQTGFDHQLQQETPNRWSELSGDFLVDLPVLGVRQDHGQEVIDTFVPGMVLTIDPTAYATGDSVIFKRLYAPSTAHTTVRQGRSCESCHNNSLAIGFGRGELRYDTSTRAGMWQFKSQYAHRPEDGLPYDAWTGFLQTRHDDVATRSGARPFSRDEQQRILTVGACLTCHPVADQNIPRMYQDFQSALEAVSANCVMPIWEQ